MIAAGTEVLAVGREDQRGAAGICQRVDQHADERRAHPVAGYLVTQPYHADLADLGQAYQLRSCRSVRPAHRDRLPAGELGPADDQPQHLRGSFADGERLAVAKEAFDADLAGVADSTVQV